MNKEDEVKFLKIQTCVLKVNIHCDGCKQKVKKLLQKVEGVFETAIDSEKGRVTVSGNVDPATLIKKLNKAGKYAELLHPKGVNITQLQKPNQKAQQNKDNGKPLKPGGAAAGGGGGKDHSGLPPQIQQMKGLKDIKMPQLKDLKFPFQKDPKSVKFTLPPEIGEDCSDYDDYDDDDEDDYDEDDMDEFDGFDADFDDDFRNIKIKPGSVQPNADNGVMMMMPDKKNAKKGGAVEIPVQIKGINGNNDAKNGKKGGGAIQNPAPGAPKNVGKVTAVGGGVAQDSKNPGNYKNPGNNGKKGPAPAAGGGGATRAEPMGPPAGFPGGINPGQMGMIPPQGIPHGIAPQGYFPPMNPEMMAAAGGGGAGNPYQQQYMAAMLQQQQQQRMMMNGQDRGGYPPMMGYPRPLQQPMPAMYMAQPPPHYGEPYTNYFSDENANSCSIM